MPIDKTTLLEWIETERDLLVRFLREFVQTKSPNPPGDTREAAAFVRRFLEAEGLAYRVIAPNEAMPNIVASFEGGAPGRHLVLNGHIDVFAVEDESRWTHGAWSGALVEGRIYGRGVADMKAGTTASIFTYRYLHRIREQLGGRLTLTAVSDEETFGPWGARHLIEHHPEVHGDCCLSGEPSSPHTLRFGDLPPSTVHHTKLLVLDTLGAAPPPGTLRAAPRCTTSSSVGVADPRRGSSVTQSGFRHPVRHW